MSYRTKLLLFTSIVCFLGIGVFFTQRGQHEGPKGLDFCDNHTKEVVPSDWGFMASDQESLLEIEIPVPNFSAKTTNQIDNINNGRLFVDRRGPIQDLSNVRWHDESHGKYYSTQLHGLVGLGTVLHTNERMSAKVENEVGKHIRNWALCAAHNPEINSRSWYEGTVIKRLSNLLKARQYMNNYGALGDLTKKDLDYLIDLNANFLLDTPEIYSFGNHGIRQDMLLAATALLLPEHPRANEMLKLAESRLEIAADELFTREGIWKEHAPGYVSYALWLIEDIKKLDDVSEDFNPSKFVGKYQSSLDYLLSVLMPDGYIPYVGSSGAFKPHINTNNSQTISHRYTNGMHAYFDYGHAVVRGGINDLYLLFVASQNLPAGKRHADDLSFILYSHGRPWITEGGHQTYERTNMAQYLQSPFAHNTYALDNEYIGGSARADLAVNLVSAVENAESVVLIGETERFQKKAKFTREIRVSDYSRIQLEDTLSGTGNWEGRLQLAGDLRVKITGNYVEVISPEGEKMNIMFSSDKALNLSTCYGQKKPICGWTNAAHKFGPGTTLMWSFSDSGMININIDWDRS